MDSLYLELQNLQFIKNGYKTSSLLKMVYSLVFKIFVSQMNTSVGKRELTNPWCMCFSTRISQIVMSTTSQQNTGLGLANLVEQCTCPEGYTGPSCEVLNISLLHINFLFLGFIHGTLMILNFVMFIIILTIHSNILLCFIFLSNASQGMFEQISDDTSVNASKVAAVTAIQPNAMLSRVDARWAFYPFPCSLLLCHFTQIGIQNDFCGMPLLIKLEKIM